MADGGLSPNSVRKHHDLLSSALKLAVRQDLLAVNPIGKVEPPKKLATGIRFYSPDELRQLLQLVSGTSLEVLVKLAGYLSLRREEILGLTWANVDFGQALVHIRQARTAAGSTIVEKDTKTLSSNRTLHMPDDVVQALLREQTRQQEYRAYLGTAYHDTDYVFTREDGRPYRPNYVSDLFTKFIRDNQLPYITLHSLRHTFATVANSLGVPMFDIGKALGYSTPATTSKIYTHLLDRTRTETLEKVAKLLISQK